MTATRPRNASQTRADILSAARRRFGAEGYERTTLRAVAADVGVDAALVIRYFGSKQDLFAAAADFAIELPDLSSVDPDEVAGILLPRFFAVWERRNVRGALASRDDEPGRSRHAAAGVRGAGRAQIDHRHPRQSRSADRVDGCVRDWACHDKICFGKSTGGQPQPRRTQPLGCPGHSATIGWAGAGLVFLVSGSAIRAFQKAFWRVQFRPRCERRGRNGARPSLDSSARSSLEVDVILLARGGVHER